MSDGLIYSEERFTSAMCEFVDTCMRCGFNEDRFKSIIGQYEFKNIPINIGKIFNADGRRSCKFIKEIMECILDSNINLRIYQSTIINCLLYRWIKFVTNGCHPDIYNEENTTNMIFNKIAKEQPITILEMHEEIDCVDSKIRDYFSYVVRKNGYEIISGKFGCLLNRTIEKNLTDTVCGLIKGSDRIQDLRNIIRLDDQQEDRSLILKDEQVRILQNIIEQQRVDCKNLMLANRELSIEKKTLQDVNEMLTSALDSQEEIKNANKLLEETNDILIRDNKDDEIKRLNELLQASDNKLVEYWNRIKNFEKAISNLMYKNCY